MPQGRSVELYLFDYYLLKHEIVFLYMSIVIVN